MTLNLDGAKISVAPLGADPADESAWTDLGFTTDTVLDQPDEGKLLWDHIGDHLKKALHAELRHELYAAEYRSPLSWLAGPERYAIIESDLAPPHGVLIGDFGAGRSIVMPRAQVRPATPVEDAGEWARRFVRHQLADVLDWLGEDPGPTPEAMGDEIRLVANATALLYTGGSL